MIITTNASQELDDILQELLDLANRALTGTLQAAAYDAAVARVIRRLRSLVIDHEIVVSMGSE